MVTWSLYEMCSSPFFRTLYLDRPTELDIDTGETELPVDRMDSEKYMILIFVPALVIIIHHRFRESSAGNISRPLTDLSKRFIQVCHQQVSELDWHQTFLPAFKACVEAGAYSLMCSYNR